MSNPGTEPHEYLSTGCFHGQHLYCNSMHGVQGRKRPASCKFCNAQCVCPCHEIRANAPTIVTPGVITEV